MWYIVYFHVYCFMTCPQREHFLKTLSNDFSFYFFAILLMKDDFCIFSQKSLMILIIILVSSNFHKKHTFDFHFFPSPHKCEYIFKYVCAFIQRWKVSGNLLLHKWEAHINAQKHYLDIYLYFAALRKVDKQVVYRNFLQILLMVTSYSI